MNAASGDQSEKLFAVVYQELRRLAEARLRKEQPGQTLQPTALVHEVYLRLVAANQHQAWDSVGHFFAAASESMRRILVDRARRRKSRHQETGSYELRVTIEGLRTDLDEERLLQLDKAISEFEIEEPEKAKLVVLRYFGGLSIDQICDTMNLTRTTANRHLTYARAWLFRRMTNES
jgi:RNA polymerase sigma factor (TIGR02999 family)